MPLEFCAAAWMSCQQKDCLLGRQQRKAGLPLQGASKVSLAKGCGVYLYVATGKEIFNCGAVPTAHTRMMDGKAVRQNGLQVGVRGRLSLSLHNRWRGFVKTPLCSHGDTRAFSLDKWQMVRHNAQPGSVHDKQRNYVHDTWATAKQPLQVCALYSTSGSNPWTQYTRHCSETSRTLGVPAEPLCWLRIPARTWPGHRSSWPPPEGTWRSCRFPCGCAQR